MNASLRASSPYLVAKSTACLPTVPVPMIVTRTGGRPRTVIAGQYRSRAWKAEPIPFQATLRRFSMSRRPSSSTIVSRLIASTPRSESSCTRAGRVGKWSIEIRIAPRRSRS